MTQPSTRYPVARPSLTELEEMYVLDAVRSGWISSRGPYLERFESEFAARCSVPEAVATNNGTTALHLVLAAAGIGPGDEVIVPALTYVATANAVTYCGARPVFVDVRADTWCLDVAQVAAAVGPRTRAVIAVDLYGHPADYPALRQVCDRHGLLLVADAAESFGARLHGAPVGSLAHASTFSFFGNKVLTCGEGGCVTTADRQLADQMRLLRNQGMDPERRYFFPVVGYNHRMTNVAAALLCAQLRRSPALLAERERVVSGYRHLLADIELLTPQPVAEGVHPAPWLASFLVGTPGTTDRRDLLAAELELLGVETRPFFVPLPELPPYRAEPADVPTARRPGGTPTVAPTAGHPRRPRDEDFPVSVDLARRGINLPTYPGLTGTDLEELARRVRAAAARVQREPVQA